MPSNLLAMARKISDYFCVGTSGPTVDGRELDPQWFIDSGKGYSPKTYQAFLWLEHYRWYGNFGEIHAMKSVKQDDGSIKMYNRIIPSDRMIELNKAGQKLHSSVEIVRNFARTEKAYQIGLGVTDSPASLSTDRLKFNAQKQGENFKEQFEQVCKGIECQRIDNIKNRIPGFKAEELEVFTTEQWPDLEFKTEKKVFDIGSWFSSKDKEPEHTQQEAIDMNEEEFKQAMADVMKPFSEKLDKVETELASIKKTAPAEPPKADGEFATAAEVEATVTKVVEEKFNGLSEQFTELMNKIDNTPAGNERPGADGTNGGGNDGDSYSVKETW